MAAQESLHEYTLEEVLKHNTEESLWVAIEGNVYDVTSFQTEHPGGDEILQENAGTDATVNFMNVGHSQDAIETRKQYLIGTVKEKKAPKKECCGMRKHAFWLLPLAVGVAVIGIVIAYKKYKK